MPDIDPAKHKNIYRAIRTTRWYDTAARRVLSGAFILRPTDEGLSVLKHVEGCSRDVCLADLNRCFGEFILETESVLALEFTIREDEENDPHYSENHAEIRGVPRPENAKAAEDAATSLAALAQLHFDRCGRF